MKTWSKAEIWHISYKQQSHCELWGSSLSVSLILLIRAWYDGRPGARGGVPNKVLCRAMEWCAMVCQWGIVSSSACRPARGHGNTTVTAVLLCSWFPLFHHLKISSCVIYWAVSLFCDLLEYWESYFPSSMVWILLRQTIPAWAMLCRRLKLGSRPWHRGMHSCPGGPYRGIPSPTSFGSSPPSILCQPSLVLERVPQKKNWPCYFSNDCHPPFLGYFLWWLPV